MTDLRGVVFMGRGEGRTYVKIYSSRIEAFAEFKPYLGTLNVRMERPVSVAGWETIEPFDSYGRVYLKKCRIAGWQACALVPEITYNKNTLEIVSPINLRKWLNLSEGVRVTITFP